MSQGIQAASKLDQARKHSPLEPPEGTSPANSFTLSGSSQTSHFQDSPKRINLPCFEPPSWRIGSWPCHPGCFSGSGPAVAWWWGFSGSVVSNSCDCMDHSPPGSSAHGISRAGLLGWVAMPFSRGSSWPGDGSCISCTAGRFFTD